ncbi:MAG: hypothetical protein ACTSVY_16785 [Candidatus Helarchaeota archaeon]
MKILFHLKKNNVDRIALVHEGIQYVYIYDRNQNVISLFSGTELVKKYEELLANEFDGCFECRLSGHISRCVSKNLKEIIEIDLKLNEANEIIQEINKSLKSRFPLF